MGRLLERPQFHTAYEKTDTEKLRLASRRLQSRIKRLVNERIQLERTITGIDNTLTDDRASLEAVERELARRGRNSYGKS